MARSGPLLALALLAGTAHGMQVSPANYRYLSWRNKTVALVGSTEHYGSVFNLDFDFMVYLDTIQQANLHLVRTWTGMIYREDIHSFNIRRNTLAPQPGRYLAPWAVSNQCCYNNTPGVPKYDLTGWNQTYFDRFRAFAQAASDRGIAINLGLHSNFYGANSTQWNLSPLHPNNNVNGIGADVAQANDVFILGKHPDITALLDAFTVKLIQTLDGLDNFYFEIINELWTAPYAPGWQLYRPWVDHMVSLIKSTSNNGLLVSENYGLMARRIIDLNPNTDFYTLHDTPLDGLLVNEGSDGTRYVAKPLGTGETGFTGDPWNPPLSFSSDEMYRSEGWLTMLAGGVTFNNLDYSFSTLYPNGTDYPIPTFVPGGGGPSLRASLGALQTFLDSLPLEYCSPVRHLVSGIEVNGRPQMLFQYGAIGNVSDSMGLVAMYITSAWWANGTANGTYTVEFAMPPPSQNPSATNWHVTFIDPITGDSTAPQAVQVDSYGRLAVTTPQFVLDIAMLLTRDSSDEEGKASEAKTGRVAP